jgi:aerobic carbon-monoxide dehydrogenase small subunit
MKRELKLTVNGEPYEVLIEPRTTLLSLIRDHLGLTGTKEGCSEGMCGACTVLVDSKAVKSCLVLALQVQGKKVTTIEGLAQGGQLSPIQDSFIEHGAIQCGFCTPGMVLSAKAFLDEHPNPSEEDVKFAIAGNLCRCTGYVKIIEAITGVASRKR